MATLRKLLIILAAPLTTASVIVLVPVALITLLWLLLYVPLLLDCWLPAPNLPAITTPLPADTDVYLCQRFVRPRYGDCEPRQRYADYYFSYIGNFFSYGNSSHAGVRTLLGRFEKDCGPSGISVFWLLSRLGGPHLAYQCRYDLRGDGTVFFTGLYSDGGVYLGFDFPRTASHCTVPDW